MNHRFLPLVNTLLTEAVCTGQNKVCFPIHTNTAFLLISQLFHPVTEQILLGETMSHLLCIITSYADLVNRTNAVCKIPAHPHAGLAGVFWWQRSRGSLGYSFWTKYFSCLTGDVFVEMDKLVQIHNTGGLHHSILLVNLQAHRESSNNCHPTLDKHQ